MNLHEKLIEVRKHVTNIQKDSVNRGQGFKYVSSNNVLGEIRPLLDQHKILIVPNIISAKTTLKDTSKTTVIFTELDIVFEVINAEKPDEVIKIMWSGQGIDYGGEKGIGKGMTYAEKYMLLKLFNIPTDDDDPDSKKPAEKEKPKATEPPPESDDDSVKAVVALLVKLESLESMGDNMKKNLKNSALGGKAPHDMTDAELEKAQTMLSNALKNHS